MTDLSFPPSRHAALARLAAFLPAAGRRYAAERNTDHGRGQAASVSRLSPYLRFRMITEAETVRAACRMHGPDAAGKFVQEVLWRTYWKGWLEMRPSIWRRFLEDRDRQRQSLRDSRALAAAEAGATGIEGFDHWARDVVETGYLHNHARMWFASIWVFTLRLPWVLGADFFLRHLLDADPASNTLSWRWVAGLQTPGKTYLATAENIARHTNGRFAPKGLVRQALAPTEPAAPPPLALPVLEVPRREEPAILLVTPEDCHPESLFSPGQPFAAAVAAADPALLFGAMARRFARGAAEDTAARVEAHYDCPATVIARLDAEALAEAARAAGVRQIVTACAPVGPVADALAAAAPALAAEGLALVQERRAWDGAFWPHARKGFFAFNGVIPETLRQLGAA